MKATATSAVRAADRLMAGFTGFQAIDQLDLGPVKVKLMDKEEGKGWTAEQVNMAEKWYKRFLFLCLKCPSKPIVPSKVNDAFWHYHILDTMKYAEDCQSIFGYFLHHFPYFGMRGDEDAKSLKSAFASTKELLMNEFGESMSELLEAFPLISMETSADCDAKSPDCAGGGCGDCTTDISKMDRSRPVFLH